MPALAAADARRSTQHQQVKCAAVDAGAAAELQPVQLVVSTLSSCAGSAWLFVHVCRVPPALELCSSFGSGMCPLRQSCELPCQVSAC